MDETRTPPTPDPQSTPDPTPEVAPDPQVVPGEVVDPDAPKVDPDKLAEAADRADVTRRDHPGRS